MPVLFALTLFVSAGLLFLIQPMVGKMVLPLLGGSPAVWNTCMVFFQALLLLGYLYSHKLSRLRDTRKQVTIHLAVLAVALVVLASAAVLTHTHTAVPVLSSLAPDGSGFPFLNVVVMLLIAVGVPFFAVSTTAPLLQRWFAVTGHPSARDPYFLYAASNIGSLLSLVSYPFLTEPMLRVVEQTWVFAGGFGVLVLFTFACGRAAIDPLRPPSLIEAASESAVTPEPTAVQKWRWLGLSFVPSSLMLGVTTHLTTDIASIPLLWVVPLALYLLTFIVAFARGSNRLIPLLCNVAPVTTLLLVFTLTSRIELSVFLQIVLHLAAFFFLSLLMHTELAARRPDASHLTTFYLWVSLGGVAGGVFNALLAPLVFPNLYEYAAAIVVGCLLLPKADKKAAEGETDARAGMKFLLDLMAPFVMILIVIFLMWFSKRTEAQALAKWTADGVTSLLAFCGLSVKVDPDTVGKLLAFAPPCMISFFFIDRPLRFGLTVAAVLFLFHYFGGMDTSIRTSTRSYFGVLQVYEQETDVKENGTTLSLRALNHGTTVHGTQFVVPDGAPRTPLTYEPLTYYHRAGPVGDLFRDTFERHPNAHVGMVGLGTGSVAAYTTRGQKITFYEIDPKVVGLVNDPTHFTFLSDARDRGAAVEIELGDARLTLDRHADRRYDLLLIDAFSSDSIPIHLMTVEALRMYKNRIADDGLIAFHVSNRYLKLEFVVGALAVECGLTCRMRTDEYPQWEWANGALKAPPGDTPGRTSCTWLVLSKTPARLSPAFTSVTSDPAAVAAVGGWLTYPVYGRWDPVLRYAGVRTWTDDYADLPQLIRSKEVQWVRRKLGLTVLDLER